MPIAVPLVLAALVLAGVPVIAATSSPSPELPALPHTVGMSGPDVELIDSGIAAFARGDVSGARDDFRRALAIRDRTAVATFNLGVTEFALGERFAGERAMRRGFRLANDHGMGASPQAGAMRAIAHRLDVDLR